MTYEPRYKILAAKKNGTIRVSSDEVTLYQACKALLYHPNKDGDATCIKRGGRCVAFYSAWKKKIIPMFGANEQERHVLTSWYGA